LKILNHYIHLQICDLLLTGVIKRYICIAYSKNMFDDTTADLAPRNHIKRYLSDDASGHWTNL